MTHEEMANIWNSLKKKLKAYCDENGFSDVILGLSGGLDSAIVSVLAADCFRFLIFGVCLPRRYKPKPSL